MESLTIELGFDWNVEPVLGVRDGIFPLQLALVNNGTADSAAGVISPYDPSKIQKGDELSFRVYDFTAAYLDDLRPVPNVLQVLFSSASGSKVFSPILDGVIPRAQLASTVFTPEVPPASIAFGSSVVNGWTVSEGTFIETTLDHSGRFNFRALLTVGIPGQMARFYRADPEMVIGDPGNQG